MELRDYPRCNVYTQTQDQADSPRQVEGVFGMLNTAADREPL